MSEQGEAVARLAARLGVDEFVAEGALRDMAVFEVDRRHGYTCEFSASEDAHRAEYDVEQERIVALLDGALCGPSMLLETYRWRGGRSAGRYGSFAYRRVVTDGADGEALSRNGFPDELIERIVGRPLADGTRVRVIVELLDEKPWPPKESPWLPTNCATWDEYEARLAAQRKERA